METETETETETEVEAETTPEVQERTQEEIDAELTTEQTIEENVEVAPEVAPIEEASVKTEEQIAEEQQAAEQAAFNQSMTVAQEIAVEETTETQAEIDAKLTEEQTIEEDTQRTQQQAAIDEMHTNVSSNFGRGHEEVNENRGRNNYRLEMNEAHRVKRNSGKIDSNGTTTTIRHKNKGVAAKTQKGGFLGLRTIETSPAVEGGTTIQAQANNDINGRRFPAARGYSEITSNVFIPDSNLEGLTPAEVESVMKEAEAKAQADLMFTLEKLGNTAGMDSNTIQAKLRSLKGEMDARFSTESTVSEPGSVADIAEVAEQMNSLPEAEINFEEIIPENNVEINPVADMGITDKQAKALGFESADAMMKSVEDFEGIPMFPAMSDILGTGTTTDSMGNSMDINGGLGFNVNGNTENQGLAWAGIDEKGANTQVNRAVDIYNKNKATFDALWAEGKLPKGLVPMVVMRMGNAGVNSNEATFRFISPYINKFSSEAQTKAMNEFNAMIDAKKNVTVAATRSQANTLAKFIADNNITELGQLTEAIVKDANKQTKDTGTLSLPVRAFAFDLLFGKGETSSRTFVQELTGQKSDSMFTQKAVYEALGDKSMAKTTQGQAVAIMGVDVVNPGVGKSNHENYAYGPKGKLIAFLKNPKHGLNLFPTWRAKSNRMFKLDKAGKSPSTASVQTQVGGSFFADGAFVGDTMTSTDTVVSKVVAKIRFAFPNVTVTTSKVEFEAAMADPRVKKKLSKDGEVIYGMALDGRIILNPDKATGATAIHEFGHIWTDMLRTSKKGRALLAKGFELVKGTDIHKRMVERYGDTELALEEAVVELLANKGDTIIKAAQQSKFKSWMNAMFKFIKQTFTQSKDLSMESIENLTLDQFIETGLADLFSGAPLKSGFNPAASLEAAEARFSSEEVGKRKMTMSEIISRAGDAGISNAALRAVLKGRGFKVTAIDAALANEMKINLFDVAPKEFGNIEQGANAGKQLFTDVALKVQAEANKMRKRKGGFDPAKLRRFALDTLKADSRFQSQEKFIQEQMVLGLDKHYNIKKGADVNREMAKLRTKLRQIGKTKAEVKKAQVMLASFIRKALPVSQGFTTSQVQKLINAVVNTQDTAGILAATDKVMDVVERQREKMADAKRKSILKQVKKLSTPKKTSSNKVRSTGVSAEAQAVLAEAKKVMVASMKEDAKTMEKLREEAKTNEDLAVALELFENFKDASLEDITQMELNIEDVVLAGRQAIKDKKSAKAEARAEATKEADAQIKGTHPDLFNADGSVRDANERTAFRQQIWNRIKSVGIFGKLQALAKQFGPKILGGVGFLTHLGTIANALDSGSKSKFFTKNVYETLNKMISNHKKGKQAMDAKMDALAVSAGFESMADFAKKTRGHIKLDLPKLGKVTLSNSQVLRVIALSLNDVQRAKLEAQGFDAATIEKLKKHVGSEAVEMVEKTVEFLSNEYFDGINEVYAHTNDANLPHIENYFPTKTLAENDATLIENGDFAGVFNAETAPALKDRSNTKDDINILDADGFFGTIDSHFDSMEKFKAFAPGVQKLTGIMNIPSVKALLEETKSLELVREKINLVVNKNAGKKPASMRTKAFDRLLNGFVSYTLSNKLMQIPKQMSSFINGFEKYQYVPRTGKEGIAKAIAYEVIDFGMFLVDSARDMANGKANFKKAMEISPLFRERVFKALRGQFATLETGRDSAEFGLTDLGIDDAMLNDMYTKLKAIGGATTTIGDIMGVMGYMTTYNRNIKNGMSKEKALQLFEEYNATQQTQRETEKTGLQQHSNFLMKLVGAFTSSPQLYFNNVLQSSLNIRKALANGETPSRNDVRKFYLNLGAAQMSFYAMAHIFQFVKGDDDDREKFFKGCMHAMSGMQLLESLPAIGALVEQMTADEPWKGNMTVNPLSRYRKIYEDMVKNDASTPELFLKGLEIGGGFNLDPITKGVFGTQGTEGDDRMYEVIGVSKSYRPGFGTDGGSSSGKKTSKKSKKSKPSKKSKK